MEGLPGYPSLFSDPPPAPSESVPVDPPGAGRWSRGLVCSHCWRHSWQDQTPPGVMCTGPGMSLCHRTLVGRESKVAMSGRGTQHPVSSELLHGNGGLPDSGSALQMPSPRPGSQVLCYLQPHYSGLAGVLSGAPGLQGQNLLV